MTTIDLIGMLAAILTTIAFVPQVIKVMRTRATRDISLGMYAVFTLGVAMWLVYGLLLGAIPIILANAVTLVLAGIILYFKLRHR